MKIVHVVEPFSSGIITFISSLVNGMPEHENIVVHGKRVGSDQMENVRSRFNRNTQFIIWKYAIREINPVMDLLATIQLYRIYRELKPEIIHLHSSKAGFLGRFVGYFMPCNIIYTPNGLAFARQDISSFKRRFYSFSEKLGASLSGTVICCSKSEHNLLKEVGIKSTYINNGTTVFEESNRPEPKNDKIIIGCLAIIGPQKNPHEFNRIAESFLNDDRVNFVWIGDGPMRTILSSSNIKITGWLDAHSKADIFPKIDIYLSCSLWEGLPFAVLEAMNLKKCLILRNCVGNVDLVMNTKNGYVFDSTEEAIGRIDYLLSRKSEIKLMGEESFNILKSDFDVTNMIEKYRLKYENRLN